MKKLAFSLSAIVFSIGSIAFAQTTPSIADLFKNASFGYTAQDLLTITAIDATSLTIESPAIKDYDGIGVVDYKITYSPYVIEDLVTTTDSTLLDTVKEKMIRVPEGVTPVSLTLGIQDGIQAETTYYALITPIEMYDTLGTSSEQFCFNLSEERYDIGNACLNFDKEEEHTAASEQSSSADQELDTHSAASSRTDMSLANVTHTVNGNVITLKWTAIDGGGDIDILLFDPALEKYTRIATVRMSAEKYDYTMKWDNEHIFRFVPLDGGKEIVYNLNAMRVEEKKPDTPVIQNVPATGPVENLLFVCLLSVAVYGGYRYAKRKA
ncbi:MAG: hypothetical protein LBG59_06625 [Candidatus Peribacteria bacterium]|jgi:hypothetical protein|nr:hypothetical protein [Candidatus Peribacteria bacterium]